jgi:hypothetical protein
MTEPLRVCRACGLVAYTEKDLEAFVKRPAELHGRATICKPCANKHATKPKSSVNYIRKCKLCGVEAHTTEELELFEKNPNKPLGYGYRCNKCNMTRYYEKSVPWRRQRKLIEGFPKPLQCSFCEKPITNLIGHNDDSLVIHSLDGNHENWSPDNKVPAHNSCHVIHHHAGKTASVDTRLKMSKSHKRRFSNEVSEEERQNAVAKVRKAAMISNQRRKKLLA